MKTTKTIGNFGITRAKLYGANWELLGYCVDTPNATACAMANDARIMYASGILGTETRKDLEDRFWFSKDDENLKKYLQIIA